MSTAFTRSRRTVAIVATGAAALLALTACAGGGGNAAGGSKFSFLVNQENTTIPDLLTSLSADQCKAENDAQPLEVETVPQTQLDQKLQLLAGQNALPTQYAAGNAPALTKELAKGGQVLDLKKTLTDLGVIDKIQPAAISRSSSCTAASTFCRTSTHRGHLVQQEAPQRQRHPGSADVGPAHRRRREAPGPGVQPFSASGEQGWPITRLISGYIFRDLGPDALQKVADGEAKLTDPEYVAAAQAVADLGTAGYFGQGVGSIDYDTAFNTFLTGKAAFFYMGSWALANFADETANQIGSENIGFLPFPNVTGGKGDASQTPANVGLPMALSAKAYNDNTGKWLTCIANNYGAESLSKADTISGFTVDGDVQVDDLTALVQEQISSTQESVLWFEALFSAKATETSQKNAAQLLTGATSPQDFMSLVQADLG